MKNNIIPAVLTVTFFCLININSQQSGTVFFNKGNELYKNKNYTEAINEYTKAIDINKSDIDSLNNRGITYYQTGKYIEAVNDFNKVIEADPSDLFAYQSRAITYNTIGLHKEANKDYKKVIELNPRFAYSYFSILYTSYYISVKEFKKAYSELIKNKELFKDRSWEYGLANFICGRSGKKEIIALAGNDQQKLSDLYFTFGILYLIRHNKLKAKEYFNKCLYLNKNDSPEYFLSRFELTKL